MVYPSGDRVVLEPFDRNGEWVRLGPGAWDLMVTFKNGVPLEIKPRDMCGPDAYVLRAHLAALPHRHDILRKMLASYRAVALTVPGFAEKLPRY
jgi:hypothetical protein